MMKKYIALIMVAATLSAAIYVLVFSFALKRPLTLGFVKQAYDHKLAYGRKKWDDRKIVVIGGSNVLMGYSCAEIEKQTGMKCVNAGMLSTGIDFMMEKGKEFVNDHDIVIAALEYQWYELSENNVLLNKDCNNYIALYEKQYLSRFGIKKFMFSLFSFEFKDIFSSLAEMLLDAAGFKWNYNISNLDINGDRVNHTKELARNYAGYLSRIKQAKPLERLSSGEGSYSDAVISDFINWCRKRNVIFYGSLPTTFNDEKIDGSIMKNIRDIYYKNGAGFIELDNNSQYGRECFFDGEYHLNEECQILHSRKIAAFLKAHNLQFIRADN